ncbi:MAG: LacI family DNA-binding transcriptional regulator [Ruminiclostridium sp.]|nr:LacI family DNA-binding transcriptional regulator [Ruminiclostridium sp.]
MIKKSVTMSDIAKSVGVSTVTVSKALGDKDGVGSELREKIKQKAAEMGYQFSGTSKNIKENLTYSISVIVARHFIQDASAFYWVVYRYIVELLQKQNYYGILDVVSEDDETTCEMPKTVSEKKVDGVIVLGQFSNSYVNALMSFGVPAVFLDFYGSRNDIDTVIADNFFGSYLITNHLFSLGHRKIGFIGSIGSTSSIQDRYLGYYKAHIENRVRLNQAWVIEDRRTDGTSFHEFALPLELPTAFVCNCDETAYILINQLKSKGLRIPEDISVVGYDNHIYSTISNPRITTVDVNSYEMSNHAVDVLIKKIQDKNYHCGRILVTGNLIERDSVKKLK